MRWITQAVHGHASGFALRAPSFAAIPERFAFSGQRAIDEACIGETFKYPFDQARS